MTDTHNRGRSGPLAGTVVLDLSRALAGPHAAMMLADMGARVIKVERPGSGDDSRGWGPPYVGPEGRQESTYFLSCNRSKESVTLDAKREEGAAFLTRLVRHADVLVENFRPGVLDRLGFSMDRLQELNPGLVVLSITGFGHDGPEGGRSGYDQIGQGEGGLMSVTGPSPEQPTKVGVPIADLLAGMYGAYGVASALKERERTGRGTVVRTSLLAAIVGVHAHHGTRWTVAGEKPVPTGNHHPSISPYGAFECADGMVQLSVGSEGLWQRFAPLVGLDAADPRFDSNTKRVARRADLISEVEKAFAGGSRDYWLARLAEIGVPAGAIRSIDDVYAWEQTLSQGLLADVEHPTLGTIQLPGRPVRFGDEQPPVPQAPPTLGQHNESVRAWLDEVERDGDEQDSYGAGGTSG